MSCIRCAIAAIAVFVPQRPTDVLSKRVCLFLIEEAGQEATQGEMCSGTITVFASQRHLGPILEMEWWHAALPSSAFIKHVSAGFSHSFSDDKNNQSEEASTNVQKTNHKHLKHAFPQNLFILSFLPTGAEIKVQSENKHGFGLRSYRKG